MHRARYLAAIPRLREGSQNFHTRLDPVVKLICYDWIMFRDGLPYIQQVAACVNGKVKTQRLPLGRIAFTACRGLQFGEIERSTIPAGYALVPGVA